MPLVYVEADPFAQHQVHVGRMRQAEDDLDDHVRSLVGCRTSQRFSNLHYRASVFWGSKQTWCHPVEIDGVVNGGVPRGHRADLLPVQERDDG